MRPYQIERQTHGYRLNGTVEFDQTLFKRHSRGENVWYSHLTERPLLGNVLLKFRNAFGSSDLSPESRVRLNPKVHLVPLPFNGNILV